MNTKEQEAALIYGDGCDAVRNGGNSLRSLAGHIVAMVNGVPTRFDGPLWRVREFQQGRGTVITLDRFEDYLLKPPREGLGIPSLLWLSKVLDAHEDLAEREAAFAAVRAEIPDFDERVEKERAKMAARKVETAKDPHSRPGNQNAKKRDENAVENFDREKKKRTGNNNASPERVIARLKRDAQTDPKAEALLQQVAGNNISARQAASLILDAPCI